MANSPSSDNLFAGVLKNATPAAAPIEPEVTQDTPPESVDPDETSAPTSMTEMDMLKNRARLMGIQFSNNIGLDALKAKIQAKLDGETITAVTETKPEEATVVDTAPVQATKTTQDDPKPAVKPAKVSSLRDTLYAREMKLIRLRITNMDPKKKELPGEIFTVANRILGTVRKFIPYGEATDNGYHVPYVIYKQLRDREFLDIKVTKDSRGREQVKTRSVREFALEILDPLTPKELASLAAAQAAAGGLD